jgi:hypothetical protein
MNESISSWILALAGGANAITPSRHKVIQPTALRLLIGSILGRLTIRIKWGHRSSVNEIGCMYESGSGKPIE